MIHPVTEMLLAFQDGRVPADLLQELEAALCGRITWNPIHDQRIPDSVNFWNGSSGHWVFTLVDFPIDNQPGRKPGDRGQNVVMAHKSGLFLASEDWRVHRVATWLLARITRHLEEAFSGAGKTTSRVRYERQEESFSIEDDEDMLKAVEWTEKHIQKLGTSTWVLPRSKTFIRFETKDKVKIAYIQGHDRATELVLTFMGYTLKPWPEGPNTN